MTADDISVLTRAISNFYGLREQRLRFGEDRDYLYAWARHVACAVARSWNLSFGAIGKGLHRDHSTIMYGVAHVLNEIRKGGEKGKEAAYLLTDWQEWA